jgi:aspartate/methionine/tyrosine aminotransferase
MRKSTIDQDKYYYLSEDATISESLNEFHHSVDQISPESFLCGAGSSTIIFTFCAWLKEQNITEVHYIQPMFFSVHHALKLFGIRAQPINSRHAFERGFRIHLPTEKSVLLLTDPIWYAGLSIAEHVIQEICEWQKKTQSLVFVDGSFQYAKWNGIMHEATAMLDTARTVRLICPTKALAAHGYRFAYASVPAEMRTTMAYIYSNIYGSASIESLAFGRALPDVIINRDICNALTRSIATRHKALRSDQTITSDWEADSGYFVYEKILRPLPANTKLLGGPFFEQKRYKHHVRINLLSPSMELLD